MSIHDEAAKGQIKGFLTSQLAAFSGLDQSRIRQLLIAGEELVGYKMGPIWIVTEGEARRWLDDRGIDLDAARAEYEREKRTG